MQGLAQVFQHLYFFDQAGMPLAQSLAFTKNNMTSQKIRTVLDDVEIRLHQGALFSQACSNHPKFFSAYICELLKIGEQVGTLTPYFAQILTFLKWQDENQRKIKYGLRYGVMMLGLLGGMMMLAIAFLLPQIESFLGGMGVKELPWMTRLLLGVAHGDYWILLMVPVFASMVLWAKPVWRLKIPGVGSIILLKHLTLYFKTLATLLLAKVDLLAALKQSAQAITSSYLRQRMLQVCHDVAQGQLLSQALEVNSWVPTMVIQSIHLGEQTGSLAALVQHLSQWCEENYSQKVSQLLSLIHPTLVVVMGSLILWIVLAVVWPLYEHLGVLVH